MGLKKVYWEPSNNKQLLNEVEQDMRNYLGRGLCNINHDNTNRGLSNSSCPVRTEFNNCFIIY